jgi:glycine amidinotransferase
MINSNTSFGKLKEIVVGRELELKKRIADFAFKHFYKDNLGQAVYSRLTSNGDEYYVNFELIEKRNNDLDQLAKVLESKNIIVHRPDKLSSVIPFQTPDFKSELSSASNVRDLTLVYKDFIIETPVFVLNRYFENTLLYDVYNKSFEGGRGGKWVKAPHTKLTAETMDLHPWNSQRDYQNFDIAKYTMAIDAAQFLRVGKDVIVNVNSYNHFLGLEWLKSFFPESRFHIVNIADNHIDGAIVCLKPGVFLVNPAYKNIKDKMPDCFKHWTYLYPSDVEIAPRVLPGMTSLDVQLASSRGMDINILSIDESTVVVNELAFNIIEVLEKNNFDVVPVKLDHCEIFGGGIHCSTLDLHRDDEYIDYR